MAGQVTRLGASGACSENDSPPQREEGRGWWVPAPRRDQPPPTPSLAREGNRLHGFRVPVSRRPCLAPRRQNRARFLAEFTLSTQSEIPSLRSGQALRCAQDDSERLGMTGDRFSCGLYLPALPEFCRCFATRIIHARLHLDIALNVSDAEQDIPHIRARGDYGL